VDALERQHILAVGSALEPVLGNRWTAEVPAEALESLAVVRRDRDLRMEFEAPKAPRAQRLLRSGTPLLGFVLAQEPHELCRWDLGAGWQDVRGVRVIG